MVDQAKFTNQLSISVDEVQEDQLDDVLAFFDIAPVEATFKTFDANVSSNTATQLDAVFNVPDVVQATVTEKEPVDVVVMRVGSTTTVVDTGVIFKTALEDGSKYAPLYTVDDGTSNNVRIATNRVINNAYAFIGIALDDFIAGQQVPIKINNTITDLSWSWELDKEILLGDGDLVQELDGLQNVGLQVANVLTPTTIIISRNQPWEC